MRFMKIPVVAMSDPVPADQSATEAPTIGDVCQACGLCCSGALFTDVDLQMPEADRLRTHDPKAPIRVSPSENEIPENRISAANAKVVPSQTVSPKVGMDQPCRFLVGSRCSVYEDRPSKCQKFDCTLVGKIENAEISARDALSLVAVARQHVAQLDAGIPAWMQYSDAAKNGGLRLRLYEVKRALMSRHVQLTRMQRQLSESQLSEHKPSEPAEVAATTSAGTEEKPVPTQAQIREAFEHDHDLAYRILNYLRFMGEYFHESSLLASYEKLVRAQTFISRKSTEVRTTVGADKMLDPDEKARKSAEATAISD